MIIILNIIFQGIIQVFSREHYIILKQGKKHMNTW